jgi:hypothetical protein
MTVLNHPNESNRLMPDATQPNTVGKSLSQGGALRRAAILASRTGQAYDVIPLGPRRFGIVLHSGQGDKPRFIDRQREMRFTERDFTALAGKAIRKKVHTHG